MVQQLMGGRDVAPLGADVRAPRAMPVGLHGVRWRFSVFPVFDPRVCDLVLGMMIGLSLAAAWHWVGGTIY